MNILHTIGLVLIGIGLVTYCIAWVLSFTNNVPRWDNALQTIIAGALLILAS